ncbi:MAG: complex I subunit 4 family protein [Nitrososphaeraceae archaeon]
MTESFLTIAVFLPLLMAPIAYILGKKKGTTIVTWFSFAILFISTIFILVSGLGLSPENPVHEEIYPWSQFGDFGLRLDGFSAPFAVTIYIISTVLTIYSKPYMIRKIAGQFENLKPKKEKDYDLPGDDDTDEINIPNKNDDKNINHDTNLMEHNSSNTNVQQQLSKNLYEKEIHIDSKINDQIGLYFALFLTFAMGMVGTVLATNLIEFYAFFELMLIPAFFLVALYGYPTRKRVSLMFFFWTHVGAVLLLLGLISMGLFSGGFDFDTIRENIVNIPQQWLGLVVFAVVVGIAVKLGAFILHVWIPPTYAESPTPISAMIAAAMSGIGVYALFRIWIDLLSISYSDYSIYINLWGLITMIYGGAMALMQDDLKKLLAYSSISHIGYIIFGFGTQSVLGLTGSTMMWVAHALGEAILFMAVGSIILQARTRSISNLGGLARKMPYTATITMIGVLTMIGVPPTAGFMAEWIMFNGALQSGTEQMDSFRVLLFALAILSTILTAAYLLRMFKRVFFGKLPKEFENMRDSSKIIIVPMAFIAALSLSMGVYPDPVINPVIGYIENLFINDTTISFTPVTGNNIDSNVISISSENTHESISK